MTRRTKRAVYRYHKTNDEYCNSYTNEYRYSYTNRHFLWISRTFFLCVVVTYVIFLFRIPSNPPSDGKAQENIISRWENQIYSKNRRISSAAKVFNISVSLYNKYPHPPIGHAARKWPAGLVQIETLQKWKKNSSASCQHRLILYAALFARLRFVSVDKRFCIAGAEGGEEIHKVINRAEYTEYYRTEKGCFSLLCPLGIPHGYFGDSRYCLSKWLRSITALTQVANHTNSGIIRSFTIAIERRDYANMYWSMNDWYTTFLMMSFFNQSASSTNILFVDAHPKSDLDAIWSTLFNSTVRFSEIPQQTLFTDMVWGLPGYMSALIQMVPTSLTPPLIEEFRTFFLIRHGIKTVRVLHCRSLMILFLWRHDYVAHPRNPQGTVQRKIANEEQLITSLRASHPSFTIAGVQMDLLSMTNQLRLITQADVVIGMHGAGLAHVLMMQKHAVMIELFPMHTKNRNNHFADLARWRRVSYVKWINSESQNEMGNFMTYIPVTVMDSLLTTAANHMCRGNVKRNDEPLHVVRVVNTKITDRFSNVPFFKQINGQVPLFHNRRVDILQM